MNEETTSGGEALGDRQRLEDEYVQLAEPEVREFLTDVQRAALAGAISGVVVYAMWEQMMERLSRQGASLAMLGFLRGSTLPDEALAAASLALTTAEALGIQIADRKRYLSTALGLTSDPLPDSGGELGRILGPDGAYNWNSTSAAAARTAATADFGQEMIALARAEGYTHKRWMTRYDSRVRESHANADRQTVSLDENFLVGGVPLRFPGDPMAADVAEVVNCRCVLVLVRFGQREWDVTEGTEPWNNPRPANL